MNTKLSQKAKIDFEKNFLVENHVVFGKTMDNVRKHRNTKTCKNRKNKKLFSKFFTENLVATEMRKSQILINKPMYLVLSILM